MNGPDVPEEPDPNEIEDQRNHGSLDDLPTICDECVLVADAGGPLLVGKCEVCNGTFCQHLFAQAKICVDCHGEKRAQEVQSN